MNKITFLLFLIALPLNLLAETLFVGDTLRVGIRAEPNKNVPSISVIKTGDAVEILERKNSYAKVRTKSGIEGWVKSAYLSRKTPANNKLSSANKKIKTLEKKLQSLQASTGEKSNKAQQKLKLTIEQLETEKSAMQKKIDHLQTKPTSSTTHEIESTAANSIELSTLNKDTIYIIIGGILTILLMGFLFGVSWYKQQVTKRLGGLSI